MAGGEGMAAAAHQAADAGESQILVRLRTENNGRLTARQIGEAAGLQDQVAQRIIIRSARLIGSVLAGVTNLYNPKLIVLGGGISKLGDLFLAEIRREVLKRAYTYATLGLQITLSPMIDDLGVTGAVHFVRDWVYAVEGQPLSAVN